MSEGLAAEALISFAFGAVALGDTPRVEIAAREALRMATARQEWQEAAAARNLLASLAAGRLHAAPSIAAGTDDDLRDALAAAELLLQQLVRTPAVRSSSPA